MCKILERLTASCELSPAYYYFYIIYGILIAIQPKSSDLVSQILFKLILDLNVTMDHSCRSTSAPAILRNGMYHPPEAGLQKKSLTCLRRMHVTHVDCKQIEKVKSFVNDDDSASANNTSRPGHYILHDLHRPQQCSG
jgi:hypothetical protein